MLIGIDGNEANEVRKDIGGRVGVNNYAFEILWGLYKLQDDKKTEDKYVIYLKNAPNSDLPPETMLWKYVIIPGGRVWILTKLMPTLIKSEKLNVFFSPSHYLPFITGCPKVCTIHDLGYLKFSEQFKKYDFWQLKYWSAISIIISKYIICPSKSTADDIVRHYPFASNKTKVVYHGYNKAVFNQKINNNFVRHIVKKYRITKNYILFLSTLKPSKNVEGLVEAFNIIYKKFDYQLVIAGKKGWLYESIFQKAKSLSLENHIIFTDYVTEEDKPGLIAGSKVFALPSFWEGFGMDVVNAMACGIPVIVSNTASFLEVAGSAGIYIDPYNPENIAHGLEKVLSMNQKEYNKQVRIGLEQAKKFSWSKCAQETLNVLKRAV